MTPYESKQQEKLIKDTMEAPKQVRVEHLVELGYTCFTNYIGSRGWCEHWYHEEYSSYPTYIFDPQGKLIQTDFSKDSHTEVLTKYQRKLKSEVVDVYDILKAFDVTCPAMQHAIKKMLCTGIRGHKDFLTDSNEAIESIKRAQELFNE